MADPKNQAGPGSRKFPDQTGNGESQSEPSICTSESFVDRLVGQQVSHDRKQFILHKLNKFFTHLFMDCCSTNCLGFFGKNKIHYEIRSLIMKSIILCINFFYFIYNC